MAKKRYSFRPWFDIVEALRYCYLASKHAEGDEPDARQELHKMALCADEHLAELELADALVALDPSIIDEGFASMQSSYDSEGKTDKRIAAMRKLCKTLDDPVMKRDFFRGFGYALVENLDRMKLSAEAYERLHVLAHHSGAKLPPHKRFTGKHWEDLMPGWFARTLNYEKSETMRRVAMKRK